MMRQAPVREESLCPKDTLFQQWGTGHDAKAHLLACLRHSHIQTHAYSWILLKPLLKTEATGEATGQNHCA
jgi:hypothetical protein